MCMCSNPFLQLLSLCSVTALFETMLALRSLKQTLPRIGRAAFSAVAVDAPAGSYLSIQEIEARVLSSLKRVPPCPVNVTLEQNFASDLKFDSGLRKDLNEHIAQEFAVYIPNADVEKFVNGAAVVQYISKHPKAR